MQMQRQALGQAPFEITKPLQITTSEHVAFYCGTIKITLGLQMKLNTKSTIKSENKKLYTKVPLIDCRIRTSSQVECEFTKQ